MENPVTPSKISIDDFRKNELKGSGMWSFISRLTKVIREMPRDAETIESLKIFSGAEALPAS
jgi:hypothetical protein